MYFDLLLCFSNLMAQVVMEIIRCKTLGVNWGRVEMVQEVL